ncbi:ras-related protein Rab-30 [Xyrauchen texanus]|uniref:ras-related protein Rab-30 n=1 Tax=Xyrauchen texanus TaxID=154827 RepID=UPI0022419552|nr:ras-related protein Rab-30 [Xyrauchen texanus]
MEDYDYLFKIVLIGNAGVGKTCLVRRFTQGLFPPGQGATIGVDFMIKTVEIKGVKVKTQTAGDEWQPDRLIVPAESAVQTIPINSKQYQQELWSSDGELTPHLQQDQLVKVTEGMIYDDKYIVPEALQKPLLLLFAGNKIDLADKREVHQQLAEEFAEARSMLYLETSAKESDNVEKLFLDLACELIREAKQNTLDNNDSTPMPGEGKTINYLSCCSMN